MKRFLFFMSVFVCLGSFVNCANDGDIPHASMQVKENVDPMMTVKKNALAFVNEICGSTRGTEMDVVSIYPWRSCEIFPVTRFAESDIVLPDTLFYIVNFSNNGGYALVNANSPYKEIVAYVEDGNLTPDSVIDNPGYRHFLKGFAVNQNRLMDSTYHPFPIDTNQVVKPDFPGDPYVSIYEWRTVKTKKPLLMTQWGQGKPYNRFFKVNGKVPDIVVATSQIVAFHQYPASFEELSLLWNFILAHRQPSSFEEEVNIAKLVKKIGSIEMTCTDSLYHSSYFFDDVEDCFRQFGYDCSFNYYDLDSCVMDLNNSIPVLINGKDIPTAIRFSWVIDGYVKRQLYFLVTNQYYPDVKYYMHCNWGRDGKDNGYFLNEALCPNNKSFINSSDDVTDTEGDLHTYNSMLRMFYHIQPHK